MLETANFRGHDQPNLDRGLNRSLLTRTSVSRRGYGMLALTDDQLHFERLLPQWALDIPLERIERIETPTWFRRTIGSESNGRPMLAVTYRHQNGEAVTAAWWVKDAAHWHAKLEAARRH